MTENILLKREQEREFRKHQERIQNMKPCVATKPSTIRDSFPHTKRTPVRGRIDKDKVRQIEKQNHRLLKRLRHIHKNYSLYMPKKQAYLLPGEACRTKKSNKKATKTKETKNIMDRSPSPTWDNHYVNEEMANRVGAMHLWRK